MMDGIKFAAVVIFVMAMLWGALWVMMIAPG